MAPATLQSSTTGLSTMSNSDSSKMDSADQKEIEAIWKEVHAKVVELAGGDAKLVRQTLSIDDVLGFIDNVQKNDKIKAEEHGTFKNIVAKTLQCINTVGGIVANAASNVFAPAGMCYNALSFVIQAWQGYEGSFESLAELLDKCVEFFERLQSYQGRMDSRLARLASQNLRLFVEMCDRIIKLRQKHRRFVKFTKQLFLQDDGVQDLLALMDKLNSKESLLVSAQTYRLVSDTAGDIKLILDSQKEIKREDEAKKWRRSIAKALGFPGTALDTDQEPVPAWQRAFDTRINQLVEGTGTWWRTNDTFSQWARSKYPEDPILVLSGPGGTGKTSMMANTIRQIRRLGSEAPSSRVVAAYYFDEGDKRKTDDDEDESTALERVSRALLWQLLTSYEAMTKSSASAVEKATHLDGALGRWDQLFFKNKELQNPKSNTAFYIFIDGLHAELVPLLQRLSRPTYRGQVRVFLTGRPGIITSCLSHANGVGYTSIPIMNHNSEDVEKYIVDRMDNMPMLQNTGRKGISEWREIIKTGLHDKCAGDFFKLNTSLAALSKVDLIEDIWEVLEEAGKPRVDQIKDEIRRLNDTRTVKEIREINEIILWVEGGRRFFDVDTMDAILSVKHRVVPSSRPSPDKPPTLERSTTTSSLVASSRAEEPAALTRISLLPLAQKLREKYPIFAITDSGIVNWRNEDIKNHIPTRGQRYDMKFDDESPSRNQMIQESEITIIKHFLNNICPEDLYNRFEFDEFFQQKLGARLKDYIHLDPENTDIKIAYTCLVILNDGELGKGGTLRQYAMYWLLEHLQAVDLSVADRELKAQVGPLLVRLFTEDVGIDSLFWPFDVNVSQKTWDEGEAAFLREARAEWLYSLAGVNEMARWFKDSSVTKSITNEAGLNYVAGVKAAKPNLHQAVLSHAAKRMAKHLFLKVEFLKRHFISTTCFLRGYLSRIEGQIEMSGDPAVYRNFESEECKKWENYAFPSSKLGEIEAWAARELADARSTPAQQSLWEIHGALQAFQLCDNEEEKNEISQRRAKKALELNPKNWHACHFVSGRPATSKEYGLELLTRAKNDVDDTRNKDQTWMDDSANTSLLARITLDLGNKLWDLGDFSSAAQTHRESLEFDYVRFSEYANVLRRYQEKEQWDECIAFITTLNKTSKIWDGYFDELVNGFVTNIADNGFNVLAQAADATDRWDELESFFFIAEGIGNKRAEYDLLFLLRDGFAKTLEATNRTVNEGAVIEARVSALKSIKAHPSDTLPQWKIGEVTDLIAQIYLDKAFRVNTSEEKVDALGEDIMKLLPDETNGISYENVTTICCLIRYDHKLGKKTGPARRWIERMVRAGLELLSDSDTDNDDYAYSLLARLFATVEDERNSNIAWAMRNAIQSHAQSRWEEWVTTPISPNLKKRSLPMEPIGNILGGPVPLRRPLAVNGKENSPSRPGSEGSIHQQHHTLKDMEKPATPPPPPAPITTNIVESIPDDAPKQPPFFVGCAGCDKWWTVMDEPLYTCADCTGLIQLDRKCRDLHMRDELKKKGLKCKKEHKFIEIAKWEGERFRDMPKDCLPLPSRVSNEKKWITPDEWKQTVRALYLPESSTPEPA